VIYEFGPFRYDSGQRLLFRGSDTVPLVPKAVETLHVLLERRGTIVEKAELMKLVWPDTTVEDVGLARNISLLRKALGEEEEGQSWIETIPRRGYRFVGEVRTETAPVVPAAARRSWWAAGAAGLLVAAGLIWWQFYLPSRFVPSGQWARIATVPFACDCAGMDAEGFTRGLNEVLLAELTRVPGVQAISPSTVERYRRVGVSMALMGRLLAVDVLVEGTVQRLGEQIRVTARASDVHTGRVIWSGVVDQSASDLASAQQNVARAVASEAAHQLQLSH
jgi:DNA-binding winged helix-turn-helix (wHTH) protein/TolB-like protein